MIYEMSSCICSRNYKGLLRCVKSLFPQKIMSNIMFYRHHGRWIDYNMPTLLDEKLLVLKDGLYKNNRTVVCCTDKYAVRQYLDDRGMGDLLNGLIGSYDSTEQIDWEELPDSFAIKCNHGCGYNIIVKHKEDVKKEDVFKTLNHWMKEDYAVISAELHYHNIQHKIMIEKFIKTKDGNLPVDYKFFASRGDVICALIYTGRGEKSERIYVDEQFNDLHLIQEYTGENYKKLKPTSFEKMIDIARRLSTDFPFVRVDLYDENGQIIFGELTFTPHGCCHDYLDNEAQKWIGSRINL